MLVDVILGTLTALNLADLLHQDKIFKPLREHIGILHDEEGYIVDRIVYEKDDGFSGKIYNFIGEVLTCHRCTSVWTSLFTALLYSNKPLYRFFTLFMGISWLVSYVNRKA
jgi:hypothetical protein